MNIFATDKCPIKSASNLCDKHVVKMILESTQMLCTALSLKGCPTAFIPKNKSGSPYRPAYENHPCNVWVRESQENFVWLLRHGLGISFEYALRYKKTHSCDSALFHILRNNLHQWMPSEKNLTTFAQAMPDKYKKKNSITAYREYYRQEKKPIAVWKFTQPPKWWR